VLFGVKRSRHLSKTVVSKAAEGLAVAGAATVAVIEHEMTKKEREKPITKGDLEELEKKLRHQREDEEIRRRFY
jgi:2-phosphoglycerate kinase